jgi:hypothetical protein
MNFPSIEPSFVNIELPTYQGSIEEFANSDYFTQATQHVGLGLVLNLEWNPCCRDDYTQLKTFYAWHQRQKRFVLPTAISDNLNSDFKLVLNKLKASHWLISSSWEAKPLTINSEYQEYSVRFAIKSV